ARTAGRGYRAHHHRGRLRAVGVHDRRGNGGAWSPV
ncbi:hypothetical protein AVDCRST_MAG82-599, partial [uncultured Rubrobacteraceae bacterium]